MFTLMSLIETELRLTQKKTKKRVLFLHQMTKKYSLGVVQQLHGQNFAIFLTPPPCVDNSYTLSVDKNRHFLTPSPTVSKLEQ